MTITFQNKFAALGANFSAPVSQQPLSNPKLIHYNVELLKTLDIDNKFIESNEATMAFTGQTKLPGSKPIATVYAGHQFGHYTPQLGDGRAALLGQALDQKQQIYDIVVKGSGLTQFSRTADGRAVLRSTIREYIASEAMHHLGIKTTRSLAMYASETPVQRESVETAATYVRIAETHIRFGHFEYFFNSNQHENLKILADYTIENHFSHLCGLEDKYELFMLEVVEKTATMIAQWQAIGFAHGVMNTDNMSILGLTFDYGPFGFMDEFDPHYICNSSDGLGRYAFDQQPDIGHWNCMALAQALSPLFTKNISQEITKTYSETYHQGFYNLMRNKLGLNVELEADKTLIHNMLIIMAKHKLDYTNFFRNLSNMKADNYQQAEYPTELNVWFENYFERLTKEANSLDEIQTLMRKINPKYILRNYLLQNAIVKAETGDYEEIATLMHIMSSPFEELAEYELYSKNAPIWGQCMDISCSS